MLNVQHQTDQLRGRLLRTVGPEFEIDRGHALPLGASLMRGGVNFSIFSSGATWVNLVLFSSESDEPLIEFPLDPRYHRTGDIWHIFIKDLEPGFEYGYRMDRTANVDEPLHRFDREKVLLDPYAKLIRHHVDSETKEVQFRCRVLESEFDWGYAPPLNHHLVDSIIYEVQLKGFTAHPSATVASPGTFSGLIERIPHLKELGITAVELMPVADFEDDLPRTNPLTGERLKNYWGYHPVSFFAVKPQYAASDDCIREFKSMVKALHDVGIEVILDVVFNHTAEGDERGPTLNFRGLDNDIYYLLDPISREYQNYSGCGNTLNCNHPVVRDLILDALRYWVTEMRVDGFRFDLASILGRGRNGEVLSNPPLLERIAADPILAKVKLIAEAWDAAGLYQVGSFPNWGRWAEWNGKFRDDVRKFVKGDKGMTPAIATRLAGSSDLYQAGGRAPFHGINFVTSHDGFTLADLVSYNTKHNQANGENGLDGTNDNYSWNCGHEGPTNIEAVTELRNRQIKNMATILLLSQGVPMILAGDEFGRTQEGNNNAYCHDNELSWIDWSLRESKNELFSFFQRLIQFRKVHSTLRRRTFDSLDGPAFTWHGLHPYQPDWSSREKALGMMMNGTLEGQDILVLLNSDSITKSFKLPEANQGRRWHRFADTALESPNDIVTPGAEEQCDQRNYSLMPYSVVVLVSK